MWNQLEVSNELSSDVSSLVQQQLNILKTDLGSGHLKKKQRDVPNLIEVDDGFLIWNPVKQSICHIQLRHANQVTAIQNLLLNHPPLFEVNAIKLNHDHKYLLLSGRRALNVAEMPSKWATRLYEGGKNEIMLKSWSLVESYFVCNEKVGVLDVHWYPGSSKHSHVAMLTNDNFIRLIDIHDPDISLQKVALGVAEDGINDFGVSIYARELGESAVSFDIGPPIHRNSNDHNRSSQALETMADIEQVYWPIYVLKGNGDILLVYTSLHNVYVSKKIYGPLKMYPSAEDNYGVDACSLIVIKSSPSLIVIGTSTGMLHHCIAMPQDEECSTYSFLPQINLYVYESIELTLSLTAAIEIDNPLKLIKSDLNTECYFCLHHSGVHVIKIPFLRQILEDRFTQEPAMETIVEHLICTRPIANSAGDQNDDQVSFPIGVTLAVRSTFLLFILLSDGKMFTQRLAPIDYEFQNATIPTKQEATEGDSSKLNESKIHHLKPVEFNEYVRKLLQRKHSAPLISTPAGQKEPNSKESFQFLLNLTQTFRNDYLVKLDAVQELIASRAKSLQTTKEWQQNEVQSLDAKLAGFINEGQRVNGKYAVTLEKQKEISQRLSKLIDKALHNYKHPTKAELEQAQQVEQISKEMQAYREKMLEIERKFNYYEKIYRNKTSKASELIRNTNRSPDWQNVQRVLNQQTEQIAELLQHLNKIKQQV